MRIKTPPLSERLYYIAFALLVSIGMVACGGDDKPASSATDRDPTPVAMDLGTWAARFCAASQKLADDIVALTAAIGSPTGLTLDQRKARADDYTKGLVSAATQAKTSMAALSPPTDARAYQDAVIAQMERITREVQAGQVAVRAAMDATAIEAANARFNVVFEASSADIKAASMKMSDASAAALRGVRSCGSVT